MVKTRAEIEKEREIMRRDYERNKKMYDEYVNTDKSLEQVGLKYNVSRQAVYQVVKRFNKYKDYAGFNEVQELANGNTNIMSRLYNGLVRYFDKEDFTTYDIITVNVWDFARINKVGNETTIVLTKLQEKLKHVR